MSRLLYTCKRCGEEYGEGEEDRGLSPCCLAEGDPIGEVEEEEPQRAITLDRTTECDRCGVRVFHATVDDQYLVDDPAQATGALCPACATEDDPHHIPGSWLLSWGDPR